MTYADTKVNAADVMTKCLSRTEFLNKVDYFLVK